MEITFLSTGSGSHRNLNGSPSALIEQKSTTILMGCGLGTIYHLHCKKFPTPAQISACCIAGDAVEYSLDLPAFLVQRLHEIIDHASPQMPADKIMQVEPELLLYAPSQVGATLDKFAYCTDSNRAHATHLLTFAANLESIRPDDVRITTFELSPGNMSFSILEPNKGTHIVYLAAVKSLPAGDFWYLCAKPNVLIMPGPDEDLPHSYRIIEEVIARLKPEQTLLISTKLEHWSRAQPFLNFRVCRPQLAMTNNSYVL